jgi:hypothetical protein
MTTKTARPTISHVLFMRAVEQAKERLDAFEPSLCHADEQQEGARRAVAMVENILADALYCLSYRALNTLAHPKM